MLAVLACITAIVIPVALVTVVAELVDACKPRWYHAVPIMRRSALSAGLLLPLAVLWAGPGDIWAPDRIFSMGGPWDIGFLQMLDVRFAPYLEELPTIYLRSYDAPLWVRVVVALHGLLLLAALLLPFRVWPPREALRATLCGALIAVTAALLALYIACASYWLLHQFSFWLVAAAGLLFQRFRLHRDHRARGH
jgi:hypothetical protein